jgi:hypothetical protein
MKKQVLEPYLKVVAGGCLVVLAAGCSGPTEDVRVTFCKGLGGSLISDMQSIEWTGGENTFKRPEYATTSLTFEATTGGGKRTGRIACYYEYDALDDTALTLADPLSAHATLPFAVSLDGRVLSDAELMAATTAEQKRQGMAVVGAMQQSAKDLAEQVRAGISQ